MTRPSTQLLYPRFWAFANFGRADNVKDVRSSHRNIQAGLPNPNKTIVAFAEIGEGDKGYNDKEILREFWGKTHDLIHMDTREPVAIPKGMQHFGIKTLFGARGVKHQGPNRLVGEVTLDGRLDTPDWYLQTGHDHAGAYNGSRPARVKAVLLDGWNRMWGLRKRRLTKALKADKHAVFLGDFNRRQLPRFRRRQLEPIHVGPDHVILVPARGWSLVVRDKGRINLDIEALHDCLWVEVAPDR